MPEHDALDPVRAENERLRTDLDRLREALSGLERRVDELAAENAALSDQYFALDEQLASLAHLYAATCRLHESGSRADVLRAIQEVLANLVGSEEIAVFERRGDDLALLTCCGVDAARFQERDLRSGAIGRAAAGEWYVAAPERPPDADADLSACIPLVLRGSNVGAIAVFRLLPQKRGLRDIDRDLFELLAGHAAMALERTGTEGPRPGETRG